MFIADTEKEKAHACRGTKNEAQQTGDIAISQTMKLSKLSSWWLLLPLPNLGGMITAGVNYTRKNSWNNSTQLEPRTLAMLLDGRDGHEG